MYLILYKVRMNPMAASGNQSWCNHYYDHHYYNNDHYYYNYDYYYHHYYDHHHWGPQSGVTNPRVINTGVTVTAATNRWDTDPETTDPVVSDLSCYMTECDLLNLPRIRRSVTRANGNWVELVATLDICGGRVEVIIPFGNE